MGNRLLRVVLVLATALLPADIAGAKLGFVYVNHGDFVNTVSGYEVAPSGALVAVPGSPFATGDQGNSSFIATNSVRWVRRGSETLLFASNGGSTPTVSVFDVDLSTGVPTPVAGSPFATTLTNLDSLAVTPDGDCLFAASDTSPGPIQAFQIGAGGVLSGIGSVAGDGAVDGTAVSPDGSHLVTALPNAQRIASYAIAADCSISAVAGSPFATGQFTTAVEFNAAGNLLFAPAVGGQTIVGVYNFSAGVPSPIPGSPFLFASGNSSNTGGLRPQQNRFYVPNSNSTTLTVLQVAMNGTLSPMAGSPFATNLPGYGIDFNLDGTLTFLRSIFGTIEGYSLAADGTPSAVAGSPFATPGNGYDLVFLPTCDPDGTLEDGEECDDGNTVNGDGCSTCDIDECWGCTGSASTCSPLASGVDCAAGDDGDACTANRCDGGGDCVSTDVSEECDDDSPCTQDDCEPGSGCVFEQSPLEGCLITTSSVVKILDQPGEDADLLVWNWGKGEALAQDDLGTPETTTGYTLCVYDTNGGISSLATTLEIAPGPSWISKDPKGYVYKDATAANDGVLKALIKTGAAGKSKAKLIARGTNLPMPAAASPERLFDIEPRLTVQLHNEATPVCLESAFPFAARNGATKFIAKQ